MLRVRPTDDKHRTALLERAATAAYIAYQRTSNTGEEAESLVIVARTYADRQNWRPALDAMRISLELREVADVRQQYERMREDHGFRLVDYSVDADAASPRVCFQFSEDLPGKRTDFSPFVAVAGIDKPALSAQDRQLCVEGLKHGERYTITLRAGIPSVVKETLAKNAEFNIYVRDRKPFVRFSGKAYVLPRVGQRGIPVVSVNTAAVAIEIYRIGDRNLLNTVVGRDFQRNLDRYDIGRLTEERGAQVWKGEMKVEQQLNADVTTAFPVDQAIGALQAGVYVMVAQPADAPDATTATRSRPNGSSSPISASPRSRATTACMPSCIRSRRRRPRARSRCGCSRAATKCSRPSAPTTPATCSSKPGSTRGEGALAPAMLVATDAKGDYAFLSLKGPAFDLTDRGVSGRAVPAGLDAFVYPERGVYRSGETVHVTALLRDGQGSRRSACRSRSWSSAPTASNTAARVVADQGVGGRIAQRAARLVGADRHLARARLHRSEASAGRRGDLHGRGLCARPARIRSRLARPRASPSRRRRRSRSTAAISMARRPPSSSSKAR